jgi:site-specific DNA-methyltransferase (adenine-specific)
MKTYNVIIGGKNIEVVQNEDGTFIKPQILEELNKFGTALKPAFEPICMAMKPLAEKNFASNVLKYGTGGINIDESRVGTEELTYQKVSSMGKTGEFSGQGLTRENGGLVVTGEQTVTGRFPANLIHDNSEEVRECFPESKSQGHWSKTKTTGFGEFSNGSSEYLGVGEKDKEGGNSSRFFKSILYYPKSSKSERNKGCEGLEYKSVISTSNGGKENVKMTVGGASLKGENKIPEPTKNNHPTVKPIALMEYLIKMITPKSGIVLEPFAGSGSTLVAAKDNGFQYIGIEMTEEYLPIIQARTGCEIIKPKRYFADGVAEVLPKLEEEIKTLKVKPDNCPKCNGQLKRTKYGMTCEDCLEDF